MATYRDGLPTTGGPLAASAPARPDRGRAADPVPGKRVWDGQQNQQTV
ncbi:MAG: hypothetical protein ABSF03_29225 [Streptosporangiaceae bacterium]